MNNDRERLITEINYWLDVIQDKDKAYPIDQRYEDMPLNQKIELSCMIMRLLKDNFYFTTYKGIESPLNSGNVHKLLEKLDVLNQVIREDLFFEESIKKQ